MKTIPDSKSLQPQRKRIQRVLFLFLLSTVIIWPFTQANQACVKPFAQTIITVWVNRDPLGGPGDLEATYHDYETLAEQARGVLGGCGAGIIYCLDEDNKPVPCPDSFSITSVNSFTIVDANTGVPLPGLSFSKDTTVGRDFFNPGSIDNAVSQGFFSEVTEDIPPHIPVDLKFSITVKPGTTFEQLKSDLEKFVVVGTDEAKRSDHHLTNTQRSLVHAGSVMLMPTAPPFSVPTLSEWGGIVLALLLITLGIVFILKRN